MAAGWPTKVTYANGDVYSASDVNDTNGTLNYIDPTAATDRQVLTRDNASAGKVKWVNSPANTLTTTGDLYYASAANTPARLGIGSTDQVLTVSGGVPVWGPASGAYTTISSGNIPTGVNTFTISSIPTTYVDLYLVLQNPCAASTNQNLYMRPNNISTTSYLIQTSTSGSTSFSNTSNATAFDLLGNSVVGTIANALYPLITYRINNYKSTVSYKYCQAVAVGTLTNGLYTQSGYVNTTAQATTAISSITVTTTSANFTAGTYVLYGVK